MSGNVWLKYLPQCSAMQTGFDLFKKQTLYAAELIFIYILLFYKPNYQVIQM